MQTQGMGRNLPLRPHYKPQHGGSTPPAAVLPFHISSSLLWPDYEFYAKYRFTPEQKREYFKRMDAISVEAGFPPLSQFEEDFKFCRALWLAANLPHVPKLQQFRYDMVIEKFTGSLRVYLMG